METCDKCYKISSLCQCKTLKSFSNKVHVFILQHPQEPDKDLGTARIANLILENSTLKTALSIPNLKKVTGLEVDLKKWVVLFLGSKYKFREVQMKETVSDLYLFDRKGAEVAFPREDIQGVIVLDGTWAQAKSLWWRNPWLLKVKRAVVNPRSSSLYGNLRREPRKECLSTIESIAYTLEVLGEKQEIIEELLGSFKSLLRLFKEKQKTHGV